MEVIGETAGGRGAGRSERERLRVPRLCYMVLVSLYLYRYLHLDDTHLKGVPMEKGALEVPVNVSKVLKSSLESIYQAACHHHERGKQCGDWKFHIGGYTSPM